MTLPSWNDESTKFGTKVRVALWLLTEVGAGNIFTKAQLRDAFPGVEQVDRRMRDLRQHGWKIDTNKQDASLTPNELRFMEAGEEVWKPGKAKPAGNVISNKERMAVMAADDFMCVTCGITGGETYADSGHEAAQLSITRRTVSFPDGSEAERYVTECKRCRAGFIPGAVGTLPEVLEGIEALSLRDRQDLASWISAGRRRPSSAESLWAQYRRLPEDARKIIKKRLTFHP